MMKSGTLSTSISFRISQAFFAQKSLYDYWLKRTDYGKILPSGTSSLWIYILFNDGCTPSDVVKHLGISKSTISSQVDQLEAKGLIKRKPSESDGRSVLLYATQISKSYFLEVESGIKQIDDQLMSTLASDDRENATRLLTEIVNSVPY